MTHQHEKTAKYTTVSIPVTLYNRIKSIIEGTGFTSVSQFVTYVLREVVAETEKEALEAQQIPEEEKQRILEKLRKLGYI